MTFPVYVNLFGARVHPHLAFESLGYALGARLYFGQRRKFPGPASQATIETTLWLLVGCVFGAWAGSKILAWIESAQFYWAHRHESFIWIGGKTIAGGLLGGWLGVEIAKRRLRLTGSTGDAFVLPLAAGIAVGRLGCFFTGLDDHTFGTATTLPWGVDFGDGVLRHPTQLYESLFALAAGAAVLLSAARARPPWPAGHRFRWFLFSYFCFRFVIEFIKPRELRLGPLSAIQLASLAGAGACLVTLLRPCPTVPTSTPN